MRIFCFVLLTEFASILMLVSWLMLYQEVRLEVVVEVETRDGN